MQIRKELKRRGEWSLQEVQFVTANGQVLGTAYEVHGPKTHFADLPSAEALFQREAPSESHQGAVA